MLNHDHRTAHGFIRSRLVTAHELTHWSGNKSRLNRDLANRFGTEAYAAEELVAELGAALICGEHGISNNPRPDHPTYLNNWLKVLKGDKKAFVKACSLAKQAAEFLTKSLDVRLPTLPKRF